VLIPVTAQQTNCFTQDQGIFNHFLFQSYLSQTNFSSKKVLDIILFTKNEIQKPLTIKKIIYEKQQC